MTPEQDSFARASSGARAPEDARALATELHKNQTDHSGKPYILHPGRVVANLLRIWPEADDDTIIAAWLHDTIEDCGIDADYLRERGYSEASIRIIGHVTKPEGDERPYDVVINDLIETADVRAMLVKIADNMDNLHPERVADLISKMPEKAERLAARYQNSIANLSRAAGIDLNMVLNAVQSAPKLVA